MPLERELAGNQILYLIVLPTLHAGEFSPFQGFSLNTFASCGAIDHICHLPATIRELFSTREEVIRLRASGIGGYQIAQLEVEFLGQFDIDTSLVCIISDSTNRQEVTSHCQRHRDRKWLHVTTDANPENTTRLWDLSRDTFREWILQVLPIDEQAKKDLAARAGEVGKWPEKTVNVSTGKHNITLPTELALASLAISLNGAQALAGATDDGFAKALAVASQAVRCLREEALSGHYSIPGTPVLIVSVPSVFRRLALRRDWRAVPATRRMVLRQILRQRQYIAMRESGEATAEAMRDPIAQGAWLMRANELAGFTSAVSVAGASLFAPVLRCPPQTDRIREILARLVGMIRGGNPAAERLSRMAARVGESLRLAIPEPILLEIDKCRNQGVKLIGDTPLELLALDGVPLSLRCIVSRLPTLPGNLLMRQSLLRRPLLLEAGSFREILLVRAFAPGDPLRDVLHKAIQVLNSRCKNPVRVVVVDVNSKEEFADAFNNYNGALAIFDGHGSHGTDEPEGTISVGSLRFNPFELYGKINVPPIVFLSACETHTFDGYEASVASAFLMMGCQSVLGTMAPVDGLKAGALIARFVLRLGEFLPTLAMAVPWSQIVAGMLRMSYMSDVLFAMKPRFSLDDNAFTKVYSSVQLSANLDINSFRPDWIERFFDALAERLSVPLPSVMDAWRESCYFTETLRYVHLGQPEHILIIPTASRH